MQMRTFMLGSGATCCRFLHANANFLMVGTAAGELHILNSSTARTQVLHLSAHTLPWSVLGKGAAGLM